MPDQVRSFPPIANQSSKVVVLGTLPSRASLIKNEYYGNPRNDFWRIVDSLFGCDLSQAPYGQRTGNLLVHRVALWDVLRQGRRTGSSDGTIVEPEANDFRSFLDQHPGITHLAFNGKKSYLLFRRLVCDNGYIRPVHGLILLPSTSSAHAMPFDEKLRKWEVIKGFLGP
jgi:hypoxanthine-DNA glycosylase